MSTTAFLDDLLNRRDGELDAQPPVAPQGLRPPPGRPPPNWAPPAAAPAGAQGRDQELTGQFIKVQSQIRQLAPLRLKHALKEYARFRFKLRLILVEMFEAGCQTVCSLMSEHGLEFAECAWPTLYSQPSEHMLVIKGTVRQNFVMAVMYESIHEGVHPDQYNDIINLMPTMHKQMEGHTEFAASSLQVFFFTAMSMLTDTLGPRELVPLHSAATTALSINAGFRSALFAKRNDIVTYNKHAGKTESPFTIASDISRSIQLALHQSLTSKASTEALNTYASALDMRLDLLFTQYVAVHGPGLTDAQLTGYLMKTAEAVEFFLAKCPEKTTATPPTPAQRAVMLTNTHAPISHRSLTHSANNGIGGNGGGFNKWGRTGEPRMPGGYLHPREHSRGDMGYNSTPETPSARNGSRAGSDPDGGGRFMQSGGNSRRQLWFAGGGNPGAGQSGGPAGLSGQPKARTRSIDTTSEPQAKRHQQSEPEETTLQKLTQHRCLICLFSDHDTTSCSLIVKMSRFKCAACKQSGHPVTLCPTASAQQKLDLVQNIISRRKERDRGGSARLTGEFDLSSDDPGLYLDDFQPPQMQGALEQEFEPAGEPEDIPFGSFRACLSPDATELLMETPEHSLAGIGPAWDLMGGELIQGKGRAVEITVQGYKSLCAAFTLTAKSPPRLQRIDFSRISTNEQPLLGKLPLPENGIIDSGASCTIFNSLDAIPNARPLKKPLPFRTSGKEIVYATHHGTCDVVIVNTADGVPVRWRQFSLFGPFSASMFTVAVGGFATKVDALTSSGHQIIHVVTHDYNTRRLSEPDMRLITNPLDSLLNVRYYPSTHVLPAHLLNWGAMALRACAATSTDAGRSFDARLGLAKLRMLSPCATKTRLLLKRTTETGFVPDRVPLPVDPIGVIANLRKGPFPSRQHKPLPLSGAARAYVSQAGTLHLDLLGPNPVAPDPFNGGKEVRYALVARHEETCVARVYPIFRKSDSVAAVRQHFQQYGAPEVISSDNGGEFCCGAMDALRRDFRVLRHDRTVPESSHQNPAERAIQSLDGFARKVFAASNVRPDMWPAALQMAATVFNLTPVGDCIASRKHPELAAYSPYELLTRNVANLAVVRALGARAFALVHAVGLSESAAGARYAARAAPGVYFGDARVHTGQRGGLIYFPETGTVIVSASYVVDERSFPVVDQAGFCSGAPLPVRPVQVVPLAAPNPLPTSGDSGIGGGLPQPQQRHPAHDQPAELATAESGPALPLPAALEPIPAPTPSQSDHPDEPAPAAADPNAPTGHMPMHARDVSEDDPEWEQDREPPWEKTSDVSDRVLRDRSKLRRPELLLNPVTMMARFRATASADVWPGFASLVDVEYAACAASVIGDITGLTGDPVPWTTPTSLNIIFQKKVPDWREWMTAYNKEMQAIRDFGAITEASEEDVKLGQVLKGKFILTIKDVGTPSQRRKVRLVLKGFLQSMMALWDLFAPTANWESILLVLALYSINMVRGVPNLGIFKIDIVSAFLHGELLDDKRYIMYAPNEAGVETAYLVLHGIPGMKQAGHTWNVKLNECLSRAGLNRSIADPCFYFRADNDGRILSVWHVDDSLTLHTLTPDKLAEFIKNVGALIQGQVKTANAFDDTLLLGMDMNKTATGCVMNGQTYILDNFGDESYLPADERANPAPDIPASPDLLSALLNDSSPPLDDKLRRDYQVLLGKCRWLCKVRLDIEHAMALLSAYASRPTQLCYRRLCQVVRYLKSTPTLGLTFDGRQQELVGFSDADHNVSPDGRSYSGVIIRAAGAPIVAYCRKQTIVTTSTACAEILALSALTKKLSEIMAVLRSVKLDPQLPISVYCDNTAAVLAGKMYTSRKTRHLAQHLLYVREAVIKDKWIDLVQCRSEDQLADILTKNLAKDQYQLIRNILLNGLPFTPAPVDIPVK